MSNYSSTVTVRYMTAVKWDGTPFDLSWAEKITIWCVTGATIGWTINTGFIERDSEGNYLRTDDTDIDFSNTVRQMMPTQALFYSGGAAAPEYESTVNAVGRYEVVGNCIIELTNGEGGEFWISAR